VLYAFLSAWSPPEPVILAMAKQFPNLHFQLNYWEGGMQFQGVLEVQGENVLQQHQQKYTGHRGG
jgi:hypothetical protein